MRVGQSDRRPWPIGMLLFLSLGQPATAAPATTPAATQDKVAATPPGTEPGPGTAKNSRDRPAGIAPPRLDHAVLPLHPVGIAGPAQIVLELQVNERGQVIQVQVVEGLDLAGGAFAAAALTAATQWRFLPAQQQGVAIGSRVRLPVQFGATETALSASATAASDADPGTGTTTPDTSSTAASASPTTAGTGPIPGVETPTRTSSVAAADAARAIVQVRGRAPLPVHGGSDTIVELGPLSAIAGPPDGVNLLRLAPGLFVAANAGAGHAEQIFLRGFNAEHGQAIAFSIDGLPLNEVNHPDGHGYADLHPLIPEVVRAMHLIEGPFSPQQGDFAIAGSVDFELGVPHRGLRFDLTQGSFATQRLLARWAPPSARVATFAAVAMGRSNGFGQRRRSRSASAIGQYEGPLGERGLWRLQLMGYATTYDSPGVVRADAVAQGLLGLDDSLDPSQGGTAQRFSLALDLESPWSSHLLRGQFYLVRRSFRLVENLTGRLYDDQTPGQSLHARRGDAVEKSLASWTLGHRGSGTWEATFLGQHQAMSVGYDARYSLARSEIDRLRFATQVPYRREQAGDYDTVNLAAFVDLTLRPLAWLTLQGGIRQESFAFLLQDRCATAGQFGPDAPLDVSCPRFDRLGAREPSGRRTASAMLLLPRGSASVQLGGGLSASLSAGLGAQSLAAEAIGHDQEAPLTQLTAYEAGLQYATSLGARWLLSSRAVAFTTHLDRDLLFDPSLGRLGQAPGSRRLGGLAMLRLQGGWLDVLSHVTYADSRFDDTHAAVPYVPHLVLRSDAVLQGALPLPFVAGQPLQADGSLGLLVLGPRPLPAGQAAAATWQLDLSGGLQWRALRLGLQVQNLFNRRYPAAQYFYASDFGTAVAPTLVPEAHYVAAAPRTVLFTFSVRLGEED